MRLTVLLPVSHSATPGTVAFTVLIVDDHPSFRASARAILESDGFDVVGEAEDGRVGARSPPRSSPLRKAICEMRPRVVARRPRGRGSRSFAPPETFEPLAGLLVEPIADTASRSALFLLSMLRRPQVGEEEPGRQLAYLLTGDPPHRIVRGDDADELLATVLGSESLEQVVRMRRVADGERANLTLLTRPVEHHDTAHPALGDKARECVDEIAGVGELTRVEHVVAVEEVEGRIGHGSIGVAALPSCFVEEQSRRDTDIERTDAARERNGHDRIAVSADERANTLAFRAENESNPSCEI